MPGSELPSKLIIKINENNAILINSTPFSINKKTCAYSGG